VILKDEEKNLKKKKPEIQTSFAAKLPTENCPP